MDHHSSDIHKPELESVALALETFLNADSWNKTRLVLESEHKLLLSDTADQLLTNLIENMKQNKDVNRALHIQMHLDLLRRCRLVGIHTAWNELEEARRLSEDQRRRDNEDDLVQKLIRWLNASSYKEARHYLEEHPEILDARSDSLMERLLFQYEGFEEAKELVRDHFELLQDARSRGGTRKAIREAYINEFGGFILDIPSWLEETNNHLDILKRQRRLDQTAPERVKVFHNALSRIQREVGIAPEILAELQSRLWEALDDLAGTNRQEVQEEGIDCLNAALAVYTYERYPRQWALNHMHLANTYIARIKGSQRENVEQAIHNYQMALKIYNRKQFPSDWATIQNNIANAFQVRVEGLYRDNLEQAIKCYRAALLVRTREDFPVEWAQTQLNLGNALSRRVEGVHRDNLEQAILCYRAALEVYTYEALPIQWADAQSNLGSALSKRIDEVHRDNLEQSIKCYRAALLVHTREDFPILWATAQLNLASTYKERIAGVRRDNLEVAIETFQAALEIFTPEAFPIEWANIQNNLADTYRERIAGGQRNNLETAIELYQAALLVRMRQNLPFDWAITQVGLGRAYEARVAGERSDNLELAIGAYQAALGILTKEEHPDEWALVQLLLAIAYHQRILGEKRDNLEQAIIFNQNALEVYTREEYPTNWARIQNNLANNYREREIGERWENVEKAINGMQSALTILTREEFPTDHRDIQLNLAWLYFNRIVEEYEQRGDPIGIREAYIQAQNAFATARHIQDELGWLVTDEQSRSILQGEHQLLRMMYMCEAWCLWKIGEIHKAVEVLEAGRAQALYEAQVLIETQLDGVCPNHGAAFVAARSLYQEARTRGDKNQLRTARDDFLATREAIRSHCQSNFLPSDPRYRDIAYAATKDQALVYVAVTDKGGIALVISPGSPHKPYAMEFPLLTRQRVDQWLVRLDSQQHVLGGYKVALEHKSLNLLIHWASIYASAAEQTQRRAIPLSELTTALPASMSTLREALAGVMSAWRHEAEFLSGGDVNQQKKARELRERLATPLGTALQREEVLHLLANDLHRFLQQTEVEYLLQEMRETFVVALRAGLDGLGLSNPDQSIALIPCGLLGVLPIHAAGARLDQQTNTYLPLQETCVLSYQASARTLAVARAVTERLSFTGSLLAVGDPDLGGGKLSQLPWARLEAQISSHLAHKAGRTKSQAIIGAQATKSRVMEELRKISDEKAGAVILIASHGRADPTDPRNCYMLLAAKDRLDLVTLQREQLLKGVRLFCASGCVTALGDIEIAPDELNSFTAGILQSGAAGAVATQWSVSDKATFLLSIRFMQVFLGNPERPPAWALREAARWLRTVTSADLQQWARGGLAGLELQKETVRSIAVHDLLNDEIGGDATRGVVELFIDDTIDDGERLSTDEALRQSAIGSCNWSPNTNYVFAHPYYWAAMVAFGA